MLEILKAVEYNGEKSPKLVSGTFNDSVEIFL